ncbi:MAG: GMC family oxidoreductase N-terminal domain-containing protein [Alphaproteobacteria bacterium]|nr:GMC family oxidoreductase N-terminal domain-containing protein [Alphaproteobacteria bacterium]
MNRDGRHWNHIIVGGGSAGCVAAAELSADPRRNVLLLEAGRDTPPGDEPPETLDPYYARAMRLENFWPDLRARWTAEMTDMPGRAATFYEQARILGGGSSVNSMVAVRAVPDDFAEWAELGLKGWSWDDILPFYMEIERDIDFGDRPEHGNSGPIPIRRHECEAWPGFCKAVGNAAGRCGLRYIDDLNADFGDGYSRVPMNSTPQRRVSAAAAFLDRDVRARPNLEIRTSTAVTRVIVEEGCATGVETERHGAAETIRAASIVLAAGAIWSPTILQRSGIGPASHLAGVGVPVVVDLPEVGANLQEHATVSVAAFLRRDACQSPELRSHANMAFRARARLPEAEGADIYAAVMAKSSWHAMGKRLGNVLVSLHRPHSRGRVSLVSGDPSVGPDVDFRILEHPHDRTRLADGVRLAFELLSDPEARVTYLGRPFLAAYSPFVQSLNRYTRWNAVRSAAATALVDFSGPLRSHLIDGLLASGTDAADVLADQEQLEHWMFENATGFFHPAGTCAMGTVVDAAGSVRGVDRLHVIDASIMPRIIRANTNITTMAAALKLARGIRCKVDNT